MLNENEVRESYEKFWHDAAIKKDSYNLDIHKEIKNSMNNAKCNELPIVVSKRNHEGWLVTMELDDWLELYISWLDFIGWAR